MRNERTRSRTIRKRIGKCRGIFRAFNEIQLRFAEKLDQREDIKAIECNVRLVAYRPQPGRHPDPDGSGPGGSDSGCGSTACALWMRNQLPGGVLTAHNQGGTLTLTVQGREGQIQALYLEGPTEVVRLFPDL